MPSGSLLAGALLAVPVAAQPTPAPLPSAEARKLRGAFGAALLDLEKEVEVVWNGRQAVRRKPERGFVTALEAALDRCDWKTLLESKFSLP